MALATAASQKLAPERRGDALDFLRIKGGDMSEQQSRKGEYAAPEGAEVKQCKSCGAAIVWIRTARGAAMPLSVATRETREGRNYMLSHYADCPDSKQWKK